MGTQVYPVRIFVTKARTQACPVRKLVNKARSIKCERMFVQYVYSLINPSIYNVHAGLSSA